MNVQVGELVDVKGFHYNAGLPAVETWTTGIVTYADQTGLEVRLPGTRNRPRLARWGEGDMWRSIGEVFT